MRYLWCRIVGHKAHRFDFTFYVTCLRCGAAVNLRLKAGR